VLVTRPGDAQVRVRAQRAEVAIASAVRCAERAGGSGVEYAAARTRLLARPESARLHRRQPRGRRRPQPCQTTPGCLSGAPSSRPCSGTRPSGAASPSSQGAYGRGRPRAALRKEAAAVAEHATLASVHRVGSASRASAVADSATARPSWSAASERRESWTPDARAAGRHVWSERSASAGPWASNWEERDQASDRAARSSSSAVAAVGRRRAPSTGGSP